MDLKSIIEDMKKLGFSEYEVKAYMSLLEQYPLNGYGLSKASGIPRSRIYEILNNLEEKKIVFRQLNEDTTIYYPLEPELLIDKLKKDLSTIIGHVQTYTFDLFNKNEEDRRMINVKGYDQIIQFLELLIGQAKKRIALSIWEEECKSLLEALKNADNRGVSIKGIFFGKNIPFKDLVCHRRLDRYLAEKKERHISVIIDSEQVISGIISRGADSSVAWVKDPGFVEMSEDFISHDVMINAYSNHITGELKESFEQFSDEARRDYFDYSEETFKQWKYSDN